MVPVLPVTMIKGATTVEGFVAIASDYSMMRRRRKPMATASARVAAPSLSRIAAPDPHLYFQAPGGQCLRLVGIDEDLSLYEGAGEGPNVAKVKEGLKKEALKRWATG